MSRKLTREERRRKIREHYNKPKEKIFGLGVLVAILLILLIILSFLLQTGADPFLTVVLIIVILFFIPIMIFSIDHLMFEIE